MSEYTFICDNCGREAHSEDDFNYYGDGEYRCVEECLPPFYGVVFDDESIVDEHGVVARGKTSVQRATFHVDDGEDGVKFLQVTVSAAGITMKISGHAITNARVRRSPSEWCDLVNDEGER